MLTEKDKQELQDKGISEKELNNQLQRFKSGFPFLKLQSAATVDNKGVLKLSDIEKKHFQDIWNAYTKGNEKITKFVPASGAASRMFKDLFSFLDATYSIPTTDFEKYFFEGIKNFAFYRSLDAICLKNEKLSIGSLVTKGDYKRIVENLLLPTGLNYGSLPKGLLEFHSYAETTRVPVEEHLVEGALYATNASRETNLHFTVSSEHKTLFEKLISQKVQNYEKLNNVKYKITFSEQKPKTDTVAVNLDNTLFRDNGHLLFRPGGHGALIENLNDIDSDIIYIKNIDNVIPDKLKPVEVEYKKTLAGILIDTQKRVFEYQELLDKEKCTAAQLKQMLQFVENELNIRTTSTNSFDETELTYYIKNKLNRPIRVCGMVKNEGEPGGGPFVTVNSDNTTSLNILEESQIDNSDPRDKEIVKSSSHFNPVDIVCAVKNYKGEKYNLLDFVDPNTGFISEKSKDGKPLKALELPGLWNGAMSDWIVIFIEVPIQTFNPVKTVNDLLRETHK